MLIYNKNTTIQNEQRISSFTVDFYYSGAGQFAEADTFSFVTQCDATRILITIHGSVFRFVLRELAPIVLVILFLLLLLLLLFLLLLVVSDVADLSILFRSLFDIWSYFDIQSFVVLRSFFFRRYCDILFVIISSPLIYSRQPGVNLRRHTVGGYVRIQEEKRSGPLTFCITILSFPTVNSHIPTNGMPS